jgi:hypothetical protein
MIVSVATRRPIFFKSGIPIPTPINDQHLAPLADRALGSHSASFRDCDLKPVLHQNLWNAAIDIVWNAAHLGDGA